MHHFFSKGSYLLGRKTWDKHQESQAHTKQSLVTPEECESLTSPQYVGQDFSYVCLVPPERLKTIVYIRKLGRGMADCNPLVTPMPGTK